MWHVNAATAPSWPFRKQRSDLLAMIPNQPRRERQVIVPVEESDREAHMSEKVLDLVYRP